MAATITAYSACVQYRELCSTLVTGPPSCPARQPKPSDWTTHGFRNLSTVWRLPGVLFRILDRPFTETVSHIETVSQLEAAGKSGVNVFAATPFPAAKRAKERSECLFPPQSGERIQPAAQAVGCNVEQEQAPQGRKRSYVPLPYSRIPIFSI